MAKLDPEMTSMPQRYSGDFGGATHCVMPRCGKPLAEAIAPVPVGLLTKETTGFDHDLGFGVEWACGARCTLDFVFLRLRPTEGEDRAVAALARLAEISSPYLGTRCLGNRRAITRDVVPFLAWEQHDTIKAAAKLAQAALIWGA